MTLLHNTSATSTIELWAQTDTTEKQTVIARDWAVRFTYKQLRAFQQYYSETASAYRNDETKYACF